MPERSATARAGANIAITKYWGNCDAALCVPANDSVSLTLDRAITDTTVVFSTGHRQDEVILNGQLQTGEEGKRVVGQVDLLRELAGVDWRVRVVSRNSFPAAAGLASSASGFAALTAACAYALEFDLSPREMSRLARRGSGSAARSILGGFVLLHGGGSDEEAYAEVLHSPDWWEICDVVALLSETQKDVPSSAGHGLAESSPLNAARLARVPELNERLRLALGERDFAALGEVAEEDALLMHSVMMTSRPALFYWLPETLVVIQQVYRWRAEGIPAYFTIDAGPNVHVLTLPEHVERVSTDLRASSQVRDVLVFRPGPGVRQVEIEVN
jgi:diphosphomevalonate decarboxylase